MRLDNFLLHKGMVASRNQASNYIKLGYVLVDGHKETKPSRQITNHNVVKITAGKLYVSRAALKLESVLALLGLDFRNKSVLDVGSSTGGFSELAISYGARKVIAVEAGKHQMDERLRTNQLIELHEQTDIRDVVRLSTKVDIVLIDVSFVSLRDILPHIIKLVQNNCQIVAMVKPQFEIDSALNNKGVIKNEKIRREIFKKFELWAKQYFLVAAKAESLVPGEKGNKEKFYLLYKLS